jgi:hypothetical protein
MNFSTLSEFDHELKKLRKKYHSLEDDLAVLKKVLKIYPRGASGVHRIEGLGIEAEVHKVKHFRCRSLKNKGARSGLRIIYVYFPEKDLITFIEIYYKDKDDRDCDRKRILRHYSKSN